jgi:nucleotide-binding universal stress UspA family protein
MSDTSVVPGPTLSRSVLGGPILCGVDGSDASLEAVRQALALREPAARLELVVVADVAPAALAGAAATYAAAQIEEEAAAALARASELAPQASGRVVEGVPAPGLLGELERSRATLAAVGTRDHRRVSGIVLGLVATRLLHDAPCSVLVARAAAGFPAAVVVGVDGSRPAAAACAEARTLAERLRVPLRIVVATRGKTVDVEAARSLAGNVTIVDEGPVAALVAAAEPGELVVVGSRGLHGLRALGSVSERVAHSARTSVLVVRTPPVA